MTNEELMRAYYYDPENSVEIMHQLLEQNMGLIYSIAEKVAAKFNCLEFEGNRKYTVYTKTIMDELVDEGILMLGDLIAGLKYDEDKGMFTTYVYPHIEGHMRRWMEKNLGSIPLSKHMMKQVREIQRLHNQEGLDVCRHCETAKYAGSKGDSTPELQRPQYVTGRAAGQQFCSAVQRNSPVPG